MKRNEETGEKPKITTAMMEAAKETLISTRIRRTGKLSKNEEPTWINQWKKDEIKLRQSFNRKRRNVTKQYM